MVSVRKEFEDKKKALADAFARKARALAEIEDLKGEKLILVLLLMQQTREIPKYHLLQVKSDVLDEWLLRTLCAGFIG